MTPEFPEPIAVALRVIAVLDQLGVTYHVGGSLASSIHGVPRQTQDVDIIAELARTHVPSLVEELGGAFYVDRDSIEAAIDGRRSFNVVHFETGFKVDIFVAHDDAFSREEQRRAAAVLVSRGQTMTVKSPADTILRKLIWFREGDEVAGRQWTDALEIVRAQGTALEREYIVSWAPQLGIDDLTRRLLDEA